MRIQNLFSKLRDMLSVGNSPEIACTLDGKQVLAASVDVSMC